MLKTDYKDDILSGNRKYTTALNSDGTLSLNDVTDYIQKGERIAAEDINATNIKINQLQEEKVDLEVTMNQGRRKIAEAITDKGVTTAEDATFDTMAGNILRIETGIDTSDATATAGTILKGYTAYTKGNKITGTYTDFEMGGKKDVYTVKGGTISPGDWVNVKQGLGSDSTGSASSVIKEVYSEQLGSSSTAMTGYGGIAVGMTGANSAEICNICAYYARTGKNNQYQAVAYGLMKITIDDINNVGSARGTLSAVTRGIDNTAFSPRMNNRVIGRLETDGGVIVSFPDDYGWESVYDSTNQVYYRLMFNGLDDIIWYNQSHSVVKYNKTLNHGSHAGTCIIQLNNNRYFSVMRGFVPISRDSASTAGQKWGEAVNTNYQYRSMIGFIINATGTPPTSSSYVSDQFINNNPNASVNIENYSWIRGTKISATEVFLLARLYSANGQNQYHAMVLTIGTSSVTIRKEATGSYYAFDYNDMISLDTNKSLFAGVSGTNLIFYVWSYSTASISNISRSYSLGATVISISLKQISQDVAMALTLDKDGNVRVTFLRISDVAITILNSNLLFNAAYAVNIDMCKVNDTKYLIAYDIQGQRYNETLVQLVSTRLLTIPEANSATPYSATVSEPKGVAVTGGTIGSSITVATPQ